MKKHNYFIWLFAAALTCNAFAQSKKPVTPATIAPVKTVKALTSRLVAADAKEDAKAKKTLSTKGAAKPVAVAKLGSIKSAPPARKNAPTEKAVQPATKSKLAKTTPAQTSQLKASSEPRKGKFGKETLVKREPEPVPARRPESKNTLKPLAPKRTLEPIITKNEDESVTRRVRPRVSDDNELKEPVKETPKEKEAKETGEERIADAPRLPLARPDRIEVLEPDSPQIEQLHTLRNSRPLPSYGAIVTRTGTPPAVRKDISIPQQRVFEIQYELAKRGFYTAEPNGLYDDTTVAAMWEFQKNYGLPATGYPTAHALKRLGLTSW